MASYFQPTPYLKLKLKPNIGPFATERLENNTMTTSPDKLPSTHKTHGPIEMMKLSEASVPWCDEYEKMICGMM